MHYMYYHYWWLWYIIFMYYSFNLEEIQYIWSIFSTQWMRFSFQSFLEMNGILTHLIDQKFPILNYIDHITTINLLTFTHFFHYQYLPTCWCSLESSWASLWLWRTCLAASLILCRSSSSSSSGSKWFYFLAF